MVTSINTSHTIPHTIHDIAVHVVSMFSTADKELIEGITDRDEMIWFHLTAGMSIRNAYNLWIDHPLTEQWRQDQELGNNTYIIDGVDHHPAHPDEVSMQILYEVWDIVHHA